MKRRTMSGLIVMALFAAPLTVGAARQKTLTSDAVKVRAAEAQAKGREVVVKLRPGTKILIGKKEFPFEFLRSASLSGRVKELREKDFTFVETDTRTREITAVISYEDVLSVKHLSGFQKTLKNVGKYSLGGIELPAFLPLYTIMALLGRLPDC